MGEGLYISDAEIVVDGGEGLRTHALTEGAMLAAITVLIALMGRYISFMSFILPVPLGILVYRHGLRSGILVSVTSSFLVAITLSNLLFSVQVLIIGVLGIALGMGLRESFHFAQLLLVGVVSSVITFLLQIFVYSLLFGENLLTLAFEMWEKGLTQSLEFYQDLGFSPELIAESEEQVLIMVELLRTAIPLSLVMGGFLFTLVNLGVIRFILRRLGDTSIPWLPPFSTWQWPWYFVYGIIFGLSFSVLSLYTTSEIWHIIAINLYFFFLYAFVIQGFAIIWFYLNTYNVNKILRIILIFLIIQSGNFFSIAIAFFGIFDTWFDFRKLKKGNETEV